MSSNIFNLEEFQDNKILKPIILKLNKFLEKSKIAKIDKLIEQLEFLLEDKENNIPASYALSIIAENRIELISESMITKIEPFFNSSSNELKINSIGIIGFYILANKAIFDKYFSKFVELLVDKEEDVRDNIHYFLISMNDEKTTINEEDINPFLKALTLEKKDDNLINLLNYLNKCEKLDFIQLYNFRKISKSLSQTLLQEKKVNVLSSLFLSIKKFFPSLEKQDFDGLRINEIIRLLDDQFIMDKFSYFKIQKAKKINFKQFLNDFKKTRLKEKEIYFYGKNKERNDTIFFEFEREKLLNFFEKNDKISHEKLKESFPILETNSDLKLFMNTLLKLGIIEGFFSKFNFYSIKYIKTLIKEDIQKKGIVNLKNYTIFPLNLVKTQIHQVAISTNQILLTNETKSTYYVLGKIQDQINLQAAKKSSLDLKSYRERLSNENFIRLIKRLPKDYLTNYHMGTQWLTNLGLVKIRKEIENSKIVGFYDLNKISQKLNINKLLLMEVLELHIDNRSGIFDKSKEIFYYSKYINDRIENIKKIQNEDEITEKIENLATELNIGKDHILTKIDENKQLIGEQIKKQDQIQISDYLEKTGMNHDDFIRFINDLGLRFFKKGDFLIFNPTKIEEEQKNIKSMLIAKSRSVDNISLGNLDITSYLVEDLINELLEDDQIKGIFHTENNEIIFCTERGIRNIMLENSFIFSFYDLFFDKELNDKEIGFLKDIFQELLKEKKLEGIFDEETLTFSSDEVVFAKDYNSYVHDFDNMVNKYIGKFNNEYQKIRKILIKRNETIYPQEIKLIQKSIDKINGKYVFWRNYLERFIRKANSELLREQGFTEKRYKSLDLEKRSDIKSFEEDPDIYDLLTGFKAWVKMFNDLELLYGNVIFYQKRLITNPNVKETENKLIEILERLGLKE